MGFRVNLNLNFNDVKMDKLYTEATKGSDLVLVSNPADTVMNNNVNNPNGYMGTNHSGVETVNLSADAGNTNGALNVNHPSFSSATGNQVSGSNASGVSSSINLSANNQPNTTQGPNLSSNDSRAALHSSSTGTNQGTNLSSPGVQGNSSGQGGTQLNASTTNSSASNGVSGANFGSTSTNNSGFSNPNMGVNFDANKVGNGNPSNTGGMNSKVDVNATGIRTGSNAVHSTSPNANMNMNQTSVGMNQNQGEMTKNMSPDTSADTTMSTSVQVANGQVTIITTDSSGRQQTIEMNQDQYVKDLKIYGINEADINRIIFGEVTLENLMEEIQNDSDSTRRTAIMEAAYLQAAGFGVTSMDELNVELVNIENRLNVLETQKVAMANNDLDGEIHDLQQKKEQYRYAQEYINNEIAIYNRHSQYMESADFQEHKNWNASSLNRFEEIKKQFQGMARGVTAGIPQVFVNDKSDIVDVISCMMNGQAAIKDGYFKVGNTVVQLASSDDLLTHYATWASYITVTEKELFNYIYNTEGTDAAYQYLEDMSTELDNRWLADQTQKDQALAAEHPILASLGSIVVTPIEGIAAVCYSIRSRILDEKIRRTDTYSAGDIWRGQVSQDIGTNYGEGWAFVYNTGMSIADTGVLIGLNVITGGAATPVLSATLMGSRAYVSTLNNGLDRGLSDGSAVLLASSSALVETLMESFSAGHLLNLGNALNKGTGTVIAKVAGSISNPKLASIATKTTYLAAASLSQGICEGEEEFSTEVLNYFTDNLISGDLSNHTLALNSYIEAGYSEEDARRMANDNFKSQLVQAFLGGFVSGVCFGSFGGIRSVQSVTDTVASEIQADYQETDLELSGANIQDMAMNQGDVKLDPIFDISEMRAKVKEENETFNLEDFFLCKGKTTGGIVLITPSQTIMTDTFVRTQNDPTYGDHSDAFEAVYSAIYQNKKSFEHDPDVFLANLIMEEGDIGIQLCAESITPIWIPPKISEYQLHALEKLNEEIHKIYKNNQTFFDNPGQFDPDLDPQLAFTSNVRDAIETNSLSKIVEEARKRVGDVELKNEIIVGDPNPDFVMKASKLETNERNLNFDPVMMAKVNDISTDLETFAFGLEEIRTYTDEMLPEGYLSVDDYKEDFIRTILDSGKINEMDNNYVFQMIKDPVMFRTLIGSENLNALYTKNLEKLSDRLIPMFHNLTQAEFNRFFDGETMTQYVNALQPSSLGKILKSFDSSLSVSWLMNDTIVNRIINMEVPEFYDFVSSLGFYSSTFKQVIQGKETIDPVLQLLDAINQKFYTKETVLNQFEYHKKIDAIMLLKSDNSSVMEQIQKWKATRRSIDESVRTILKNCCEVDVVEKNGSLVIPTHEDYRYYNVTYELDGIPHKVEIKTNYVNELELSSFLADPTIVNAAVKGNLEIVGITPILDKSNLVLTERSGLKPGLNEVLLEVDGVPQKIVVNSLRKELDLNQRFSDSNAVVKVVWPKGSFHVDVPNKDALYRVTYRLESGQIHQAYMTTDLPTYGSNLTEYTLNIDDFIQTHNLVGVTDVDVEEVMSDQVKASFPMIEQYSASKDIYTNQKYGGNQADAYYLLSDKLNGKPMSEIDLEKANLLSALVDQYFPNATEVQKLNLASNYAQCGCFYTAISNAFTTYMGSVTDGSSLFYHKFGYRLQTIVGNEKSYNNEVFAFDMYLNYISDASNHDVDQVIQSNLEAGISPGSFHAIVTDYFAKHGVQISGNFSSVSDKLSSIDHNMFASVLNDPTGFHILSAKHFDLDYIGKQTEMKEVVDQALKNTAMDGTIYKDIENHAMLITGIDDQMNLMLSSWGKQYKLIMDSFREHQLQGKTPYASILNLNFSLLPDNVKVEPTFHVDSNIHTVAYHAMEFSKSKTEVLNQHAYLQEVKKHVSTAIDIMDKKYEWSGLDRLESYLITGNISDITRQGNAREYIESLSIEDLTQAINSYILEYGAHELFYVENKLTPKEAIAKYNQIIDQLKLPKGKEQWYSYQDYMAYVARCKKAGVSYFTNFSYLNAETQLQQLKNQFQYKKHYISLKTKQDIFQYFGHAGDHFYGEVIKGIKEISSASSHPITGLELERIKDINYLEYMFSKPSKRLVKYLKMIKEQGFSEFKNTISNQDDTLTPETQQGILQYMQQSVQGKFISNLSVKEVLAIYEYTVGSGTILQWLAGVPMHSNYRIKDPVVLNHIIHGLDTAIIKYGGLKQNMILYRGDSFQNLALWKTIDVSNYESLKSYVGQTVLCDKFLSTGVSESGAFGGEVLWRIKAPIGTQGIYINDLSAYFSCDCEYEFVVKRRSELRIDNVFKKGEQIYIEAKIVGYR